MKIVDISKLDEKEIDKMVQNLKTIIPDNTLNQNRHYIAKILGAKNWKSLTSALNKSIQKEESMFVILRNYNGEESFSESYFGKTKKEVTEKAYNGFVKESFEEYIKNNYDWNIEDDSYIDAIDSFFDFIERSDSEKEIVFKKLKDWTENYIFEEEIDPDFVIDTLGFQYGLEWYIKFFNEEEDISFHGQKDI